MKVYRDIEQGSEEWFRLRINKATASEFEAVCAKGEGKTREKYLNRVVTEALLGKPIETFRNSDTDRGTAQEQLARLAYEAMTDHELDRVSFIEHDSLRAGCSPDSLIIGQRRGIEVKCVLPHVQTATVRAGKYPTGHRPQIQGSMWISGFEEWDFVSYCPDMPSHLRLYTYTVKRDEDYIRLLEGEVRRFLRDVDTALDALRPGGPDLESKLRASLKEPACA